MNIILTQNIYFYICIVNDIFYLYDQITLFN